MEIEIKFFVYRGVGDDEEEIELTIIGDAEPYVSANLRGHPDNWTPPEGGHVCVEAVLLGGKPWDCKLTDKETKDAEAMLYQAMEDYEPEPDSGYDDYIDRQYYYGPY